MGDPSGRDTGDYASSIAVLPFSDLSPDGDQEYFGDGLAEELFGEANPIGASITVGTTKLAIVGVAAEKGIARSQSW